MKTLICDLSYGDTGKGRVSAYFCEKHNYQWSVRFNGSNNAGHTVYDNEGTEYKLHHLPAGAVFGKKIALDAGMAINLEELKVELKTLKHPAELYISKNVHLIQDKHLKQDSDGSGIGSTKRGIAYVYADRALRKGIRIENIKADVEKELGCTVYSGLPPFGAESALYEGAQGIMLDVDYGNYPYVTSSSVMPSMAHKIGRTIGVMKGYVTRVGDGPPYTPDVPELRERGKEFGATTGRPRKCTWLNEDDVDYAISIVQPDEIVVTKLDILDGMKIGLYKNSKLSMFDTLDSYENYLLERFPQIKWFSKSPSGELLKV
ncbi:MAG: adenylosuccinate synthetase [Patescibacteria group bacterium]